ncbi:MAG: YidC/Oxa1 family insertase periplasmic-domain containing protein [Planctomycetaceae bacterium]|nr:YidC/Oxa1 family insertase periplasmic-domain containing protein [Planctomycetaceae bacterium]
MSMKTAVTAGLVMFCVTCGWLVFQVSAQHKHNAANVLPPLAASENAPAGPETAAQAQSPTESDTAAKSEAQASQPAPKFPILNAENSPEQTVELGALYPEVKRTADPDKYKFKVVLTARGAAVQRVILSEFEARVTDQTEMLSADQGGKAVSPLILLAPLDEQSRVYSLANTSLKIAPADAEGFGTKSFPLDKLNWKLADTDHLNFARFEAVLFEAGQDPSRGEGTLKLVKTYRINPGSYEVLTELSAQNLSGAPLKLAMQFQGPTGVGREDLRQDNRKVMAAYKNAELFSRLLLFRDVQSAQRQVGRTDVGLGASLKRLFGSKEAPEQKLRLRPEKSAAFVWAAMTNKYFAAILRPINDESSKTPLQFGSAHYYGSFESESLKDSVGEVSFTLDTDVDHPITLAAAGQEGQGQNLTIATYLGPKDREIFEANPVFKTLGYFHTIDFQACCCPTWMIAPLAFGIIWLMKTLFTLMGPWGNYGVVIMFLVFVVRLILHPVTKKSQVSMMRMQKLGPKMQEIQKKYANNRAEMNKQVMQLYKEGGATPVMGMLPMFLQMPIWIALWTAVYTSVDLRGAGFLPFWITDLSIPDHLFRIPYAATMQQLPLVGWLIPEYFNLLPILMGFVMYLQQKLMPAAPAAATNPQMAQQQKMMLIMMPLLFPVMLYNGPSGVNLYIMSSIGAGVIEQKVIRKHIQQRQEEEEQGKVPTTSKLGGKLKKKKPKPFFKG